MDEWVSPKRLSLLVVGMCTTSVTPPTRHSMSSEGCHQFFFPLFQTSFLKTLLIPPKISSVTKIHTKKTRLPYKILVFHTFFSSLPSSSLIFSLLCSKREALECETKFGLYPLLIFLNFPLLLFSPCTLFYLQPNFSYFYNGISSSQIMPFISFLKN